jgi:Sodium/hydrogen exchanger family
LISVASITFVIAGFLVLASVVQPAAERLHLPYTVLLAILGVALGGVSSFLLYTPLTNVFDNIVRPLVDLPFNASIFLVVFLPLLLFHAALTIDLREIAPDWAPILTLAIVAVFAAAAAIGFSLSFAAGLPLTVALLLDATTDPSAVVAIFHELGAPARLTRLLEGESLLNESRTCRSGTPAAVPVGRRRCRARQQRLARRGEEPLRGCRCIAQDDGAVPRSPIPPVVKGESASLANANPVHIRGAARGAL